jgi:hypothetical protein
VLHPKTLEHLDAAGIHSGRDINLQLAVGNAHHGIQVGIEVEQLGGAIESRHHRFEWIVFFYFFDVVDESCGHG